MRRIGLPFILIVLVLIAMTATIARALFPGDLGARMEPARMETFLSFGILAPERTAEVEEFDSRFAANPSMTMAHILPGGVFLTFALFQFSSRIRNRHLQFHRWSGRTLVFLGLASSTVGLYFGILMPYAGWGEGIAIFVFGCLFALALVRAFVAIRKGQVALHREWMIRAFAVAIGISTVRIVSILIDLALTPLGFGSKDIFVLSLWTGWIGSIVVAELWIRHTRTLALQNV